MPGEDENLKRLACVVGGGALGAPLLRTHYDATRKSHAEKDDPEGSSGFAISSAAFWTTGRLAATTRKTNTPKLSLATSTAPCGGIGRRRPGC